MLKELSDIDIGVVLDEDATCSNNPGQIYNELYDIFTDIFPGKEIDIAILQKASLELRFDVIRHGKILYHASSADQFNFEERTMLLYADFKPLLAQFNQAILER